MDAKRIIEHIVKWLKDYSNSSKTEGFVIGISGGIDSAVTSTLCALTGKKVIVLNMPIKQFKTEFERSNEHINWLKNNFKNVEADTVDLTIALENLESVFSNSHSGFFNYGQYPRAFTYDYTLWFCHTSQIISRRNRK